MNFPNGIFFNLPHPNAPDFVKGAIGINRDQLMNWLKEQPEKINLDLKVSREGKSYCVVNDWQAPQKTNTPNDYKTDLNDSIDIDDGLPF